MYVLLENQESMRRLVVLDTKDGVVESLRDTTVVDLVRKDVSIRGLSMLDGQCLAVEQPVPVVKVTPQRGTPVIKSICVRAVEYASTITVEGYRYGLNTHFSASYENRSDALVFDNNVVGDFLFSENLSVSVQNLYRDAYFNQEYTNGVFRFEDSVDKDYHTNIGDEVNFVSLGDFLVKHLRKGIVADGDV